MALLALCISALGLAGEQAPSEANFIRNSSFENGSADWELVDTKGGEGGAVVEEADGNRALVGQGEQYWLASTGPYFRKLPLAQHAGKPVTLSFRAKGDEDAYPGFILVATAGGKAQYKTLFWKTKYHTHNITLTPRFTRYERTTVLPPDLEEVHCVRAFNCTRRGKVFFDDIRLTLGKPKEPDLLGKPEIPPDWRGSAFTEREIIELGNTRNYLLTQWSKLYGAILDLERARFYAGGPLPESMGANAQVLRQELMGLRGMLRALDELYIEEFRREFGKIFSTLQPYRFYRDKDYAGRSLLFAVGNAKSKKKPFVALEARFQAAHKRAAGLLRAVREQVSKDTDYTPVSTRTLKREGPPFDEQARPRRILFGLRCGPDMMPTQRWIDFDFYSQLIIYPEYDAQGDLHVKEVSPETDIRYWGLRGLLRPLVDPYVWWLPPAFRERCRVDSGLFAHTERGVRGPTKRGDREVGFKLNYFSKEVEDTLSKYYEQYTRECSRLGYAFGLYYAAEFGPLTTVDGAAHIFGYSTSARDRFRSWLEAKFGGVGKLNAAWGSAHQSFDDIQPPTRQVMQEMSPEHLPRIYEFRKFRKHRFADVFKTVYDACHRGSDLPVMTSGARAYMNGNSFDANDAFRLAQAVDIYCNHACCDGSYKHMAEQVYCDSIARYLGNKPRGTLEYYPGYPEIQHFNWDKQDTILLYRRVMSNLWKDLATGNQVICLWPFPTHRSAHWNEHATDRRSGYTLACDYLGAVPLVQSQLVDGLEAMLLNTQIVPSAIGLLAPYDGTMVCYPDGQIMTEAAYIHKFLADRNYDYRCVPEELIVDGRESLASFKVLIAPYTLWASRALQEKLLAWVSRGGIMVAIAPFGIWDEYGRPCRTLIDAAFGQIPISLERERVYRCAYPREAVSKLDRVKIETVLPYQREQINLVSAGHGRGRIHMTADTTVRDLYSGSKRAILAAIDDAIGVRNAWCRNAKFDLFTREDRSAKTRHVVAINRSVTEPNEDTLVVKGEYQRPVDICIAGGCPPRAHRAGGVTAFKVRLGPGEGTCIRLGSYEEPKLDMQQIRALTGSGANEQRQKVLAALRRIAPSGDPVADVKAGMCRSVALDRLSEEDYPEALAFAQKALRRPATSPPDGHLSAYCSGSPQIDGDASDWVGMEWTRFGSCGFKAKWDEEHLYFLVEIEDPLVRNPRDPRHAWSGDSAELYLDVLNQGGSRKPGWLDYQYMFACDGTAGIIHKKLHRPRQTKVKATRTAKGFIIEAAIAHEETRLIPVSGYDLAFNVRRIDWGQRPDGGPKYLGDQMLKSTGFKPFENTSGWPTLRLAGGPDDLGRPSAKFVPTERAIVVRGRNNTLQSIAQQIRRSTALQCETSAATLGADLRLCAGAELVLSDVVLRRASGSAIPKIVTEGRCYIRLMGNAKLEGLDAEALKQCRFEAIGRHVLSATKPVRVRAADRRGRPVTETPVRVVATEKGSVRTVLDKDDAHLDKDGIVTFHLPVWIAIVEGHRVQIRTPRYDVLIDDKNLNASYPINDLDPSKQSEFTVTFTAHRGVK